MFRLEEESFLLWIWNNILNHVFGRRVYQENVRLHTRNDWKKKKGDAMEEDANVHHWGETHNFWTRGSSRPEARPVPPSCTCVLKSHLLLFSLGWGFSHPCTHTHVQLPCWFRRRCRPLGYVVVVVGMARCTQPPSWWRYLIDWT